MPSSSEVHIALDFVKNKWANFNPLSDRDLTFKLVILLALTSASRACTLHRLYIYFMARHSHFVQFMFGKLDTVWKDGKSSPAVRYYKYDADRDLCVRATFDVYLERNEFYWIRWTHTRRYVAVQFQGG